MLVMVSHGYSISRVPLISGSGHLSATLKAPDGGLVTPQDRSSPILFKESFKLSTIHFSLTISKLSWSTSHQTSILSHRRAIADLKEFTSSVTVSFDKPRTSLFLYSFVSNKFFKCYETCYYHCPHTLDVKCSKKIYNFCLLFEGFLPIIKAYHNNDSTFLNSKLASSRGGKFLLGLMATITMLTTGKEILSKKMKYYFFQEYLRKSHTIKAVDSFLNVYSTTKQDIITNATSLRWEN